MTVHCPHCLTGYLLPEHLLGGRGARVRCPGCEEVFVVLPEDGAAGETADASAADAGKVVVEPTSRGPSGGSAPMSSTGATPGAGSPVGAAAAPPSATLEAEPSATRAAEPAMVAGAVLDVLADFLGDALTRSRTRRTVLSDHGPAIVAVWEEYRRRVGADAPSAVFRAALRDRCGVDLSHANRDQDRS